MIMDYERESEMKNKGVLSGIIMGVACLFGILIGIWSSYKVIYKQVYIQRGKIQRSEMYYSLLLQWIVNLESGKTIEKYLLRHGFSNIAIYGVGEVGKRVSEELKDTNVKMVYAIDREAVSGTLDVNTYHMKDDVLPDVDAVIVTPIFHYRKIAKKLKKKVDCPIISLETIICSDE